MAGMIHSELAGELDSGAAVTQPRVKVLTLENMDIHSDWSHQPIDVLFLVTRSHHHAPQTRPGVVSVHARMYVG